MDIPRRKLRRLLIWLCAGVLVYFGARTVLGDLAACWTVHGLAADEPGLDVVPTPLPAVPAVALNGPRIERFGISFQLPWKSVVKERALQSIDTLQFSNGAVIALWSPPSQVDSLSVLRKSGGSAVDRILGASADRSNYAYMTAAMAATPDQAQWWKMPRENARCLLLMTQKSIDVLESRTIHPISAGTMRGFQFGNASDPVIRLILFDPQDRRYMVVIGRKRGVPSPLTQAEINALVASLRVTLAGTAPPDLPVLS